MSGALVNAETSQKTEIQGNKIAITLNESTNDDTVTINAASVVNNGIGQNWGSVITPLVDGTGDFNISLSNNSTFDYTYGEWTFDFTGLQNITALAPGVLGSNDSVYPDRDVNFKLNLKDFLVKLGLKDINMGFITITVDQIMGQIGADGTTSFYINRPVSGNGAVWNAPNGNAYIIPVDCYPVRGTSPALVALFTQFADDANKNDVYYAYGKTDATINALLAKAGVASLGEWYCQYYGVASLRDLSDVQIQEIFGANSSSLCATLLDLSDMTSITQFAAEAPKLIAAMADPNFWISTGKTPSDFIDWNTMTIDNAAIQNEVNSVTNLNQAVGYYLESDPALIELAFNYEVNHVLQMNVGTKQLFIADYFTTDLSQLWADVKTENSMGNEVLAKETDSITTISPRDLGGIGGLDSTTGYIAATAFINPTLTLTKVSKPTEPPVKEEVTPEKGRTCQDDGFPAGYYWNGTACVIDKVYKVPNTSAK